MKKSSFASSLLLLSSLASGSALAQSAEEVLQAQAQPIILNSCAASCHNGSVSPIMTTAAGEVNWTVVKANAARILARVQASTMPPANAPQAQKITEAQRKTLVDYTTLLTSTTPPDNGGLPIPSLKVASGFGIELFAKAQGARSLAVTPDGIVFVGTGGFSNVDPNGRVYAVVPTATGRKVLTLAWNLNNPNGVALQGNDLYVAELTRVIKFKDAVGYVKANINKDPGKTSAPFTAIYSDLPEQPTHSWKYLSFGPDQKLYINIGAPCNICLPDRNTYASIFRMNTDGTDFEIVARGVRNTVGLAWHPVTGDLWFTDNGRDELGDNIPPDELNRLSKSSLTSAIVGDYGYPYCHAKTLSDPTYGRGQDCNSSTFTKPEVELGAHVAALGLTFYTGKQFPAAYQNAVFIAEHGSWNRSKKSGYRLSVVQFPANSYQPLISGWLDDAKQTNWGRPVDVKNYIDGSLLLSDDQTGAIYRIFYKAN